MTLFRAILYIIVTINEINFIKLVKIDLPGVTCFLDVTKWSGLKGGKMKRFLVTTSKILMIFMTVGFPCLLGLNGVQQTRILTEFIQERDGILGGKKHPMGGELLPLVSDPVLTWNTFLGSADWDEGYGVAVDSSGNIFVVGMSLSSWGTPLNPFSVGPDAFIAKLNSNGELQWHTFLGSSGDDSGSDLAVDSSGNVYMAGNSNGDIFIAKLNSSGALQWDTVLGSEEGEDGKAIVLDGSNNIYVSGVSYATWGSPVAPHSGGQDAFVAKLNSSGELQWNTFLGSSSSDQGSAITLDSSGNVYVTGFSNGNWGTPVSGYTGDKDAFVAKLNSSGELQWHTFMGSSTLDQGNGILEDSSGNTYVTGESLASWGGPLNSHKGQRDAFVAKLNSSGVRLWHTFMGGTLNDYGKALAMDSSGNILVAGGSFSAWGTPLNDYSGAYDVLIAYLNSNGILQWHTFVGGTSNDYCRSMVLDSSENIIVAGTSTGTWGSPINPFTGSGDPFAAKLGPEVDNITVTSPNGGESWNVGSTQDITWAWGGTVGDVGIEYSTDNGSSWLSVISSTANDGSHPWTIPDTPSANCQVRVSEAADGDPYDVSDSTFAIQQATVQYTLTISATTGGTTDPTPGGHDYNDGTPVEVDALPNSGYLFSYWSGDVSAGHETDNPVTVTVDGDKSITANFVQIGWKSTSRLTWNPSDSDNPSVAVDSNRYVHVVWEDDNPGDYEIYYRRSTDGGVTWAGAKRLTWNAGDSRNPAIAIDADDYIHVVWDDDTPGRQEIYYRKSTNGGVGWTAVKRLTQLNGDSRSPSIAADPNDNLHIVWYDTTPGNNEIYYAKSTNEGVNWTNPKRMTWNASSSAYPAIAAGTGNDIHIVWQDDGPGNDEIYYKRSTNGGTTWPLTKRMTWNSGDSMYPSIASDTSDNIHLVWTDLSSGNNEVFYKKSTNGGTNWPMTKRLTWNSGTSAAPVIATDLGDNIYVGWNDNTPGNYEIFFKRSSNGGTSWSTKRLTWNGGDSLAPDIATYSTGEIHIAWADSSPVNQEIYYRKGIQ